MENVVLVNKGNKAVAGIGQKVLKLTKAQKEVLNQYGTDGAFLVGVVKENKRSISRVISELPKTDSLVLAHEWLKKNTADLKQNGLRGDELKIRLNALVKNIENADVRKCVKILQDSVQVQYLKDFTYDFVGLHYSLSEDGTEYLVKFVKRTYLRSQVLNSNVISTAVVGIKTDFVRDTDFELNEKQMNELETLCSLFKEDKEKFVSFKDMIAEFKPHMEHTDKEQNRKKELVQKHYRNVFGD